jgi:putative DNA primase/helicase
MLSLAPDAKAAWVAYHDAIESELASGGELYDVRDVASKSADNAARLAALFQNSSMAWAALSGWIASNRASRIAAWHLSEARRFFGELALPAELADAARLDSWLIEYCRKGADAFRREESRSPAWAARTVRGLMRRFASLPSLTACALEKAGKRLTITVNPALVGVAP